MKRRTPPPTPSRTAEERAILDLVARSEGRVWAEAHAEMILEQARQIGNLRSEATPRISQLQYERGDEPTPDAIHQQNLDEAATRVKKNFPPPEKKA